MDLNEIVSRFEGVKRLKSDSYQVKCPCHNDKRASLSITGLGDKILMKCHAGCDTRDIVKAVGISMKDLDNGYVHKNKDVKKWWEGHFSVMPLALYDYGEYVKVRLPEKKIFYGRFIEGNYYKGIGKCEKTLYKKENILKAKMSKKYIYICEGEKDADNLIKKGFYAVTPGGVNDWKKEYAQLFKGAYVILLPDNDEPGIRLMEEIKKHIKWFAFAIKTVITSKTEKGDVSDYFEEGNSTDDFKILVERAQWEYAEYVYINNDRILINADMLASHIGRVVPNIIVSRQEADISQYYCYEKGVYKKYSKLDIKALIKGFLPIGMCSDTLLNNTYNLIMAGGDVRYCIEELNKNDNIINCINGLYNIKRDELLPHSHRELTSVQLKCRYNREAKKPEIFYKYINDLCSEGGTVDESKKLLLQEWLGLLLSNISVYEAKKSLMLYSPLGNTGKSVFLNLIKEFLGVENTINIPLQKMSDRFATADLYGKRVNIVGDQQSNDIDDSSGFKQATGGDLMKVEFKGKGGFNWIYTGGIVIACNDLPTFTDDKGGHIFERFCIVPCVNTIDEDKRDGRLINKLSGELEGIFLWAMEGLRRLIKNNFKFTRCEASEECITEYRENVDTFFRFLKATYDVTGNRGDKIKKTDLENEYVEWYRDNVNVFTVINKRKIKEKAEKNGVVVVKLNGYCYYAGIKRLSV